MPSHRRLAAAALGALVLAGCSGGTTHSDGPVETRPGESGPGSTEPTGALAVTSLDDAPSAIAISDGDLWPNCWSDDDALYAGYGDGAGFGPEFSDIGVARIDGTPDEGLDGESLAWGDELGQVWSGPDFTRKPTGMLCRDGALYLAVQDLRHDFNAAPAATIARSDDKGRTWDWDTGEPMFDDGIFSTIFFLDYGQDSEHAPDDFVYAYGLDHNWRDSFDDSVPDPQELHLARVPAGAVQDRSAWEFFSGTPEDPQFSPDVEDREPVLIDERMLYPAEDHDSNVVDLTVISQGGVVYLPALESYLYTSWTEFTFEFYSAPAPWGPWEHILSEDFGSYPWTAERIGGYGVTVPSKFISDDGTSAWVQSNVCPCAPAGTTSYWFGLRQMTLAPG